MCVCTFKGNVCVCLDACAAVGCRRSPTNSIAACRPVALHSNAPAPKRNLHPQRTLHPQDGAGCRWAGVVNYDTASGGLNCCWLTKELQVAVDPGKRNVLDEMGPKVSERPGWVHVGRGCLT